MFYHDVRRRLEPAATDGVREMPAPERETRLNTLKRRLNGLTISGTMEPSKALIDEFADMRARNELRYISWKECSNRSQEIASGDHKRRRQTEFSLDASGFLKGRIGVEDAHADTSSTLLVKNAMTRRGLAADVAGVMSFEAHARIVDTLFTAFHRPPPDPRYAALSIDQLRMADIAIFTELSDRLRTGIRPSADGVFPIDVALDKILESFAVQSLLTPLPAAPNPVSHSISGPAADVGVERLSKNQRKRLNLKKLKEEAAAAKTFDPPTGKGSGSSRETGYEPNRKGGGKKGGKKGQNMPSELRGFEPTKDGKRLCFDYHCRGCQFAAPGAWCRKGWHSCPFPSCNLHHTVAEHRACGSASAAQTA